MIAGGCRCGAVRYTLAIDDLPAVYCCHCRDCQTGTASAFAEQAPVRSELLRIVGPVVEHVFTTLSGSTSRHAACGTCHTRLYNANSALPDFVIVRAGSLDRSDDIVPCAHIWTRRKQPWIIIGEGVPQFAETPPLAELAAILRAQ